MILQHIVEMPRLYSGRDRQGRAWTCLHLPEGFGHALGRQLPEQRVKTLRGLLADYKHNVRRDEWPN